MRIRVLSFLVAILIILSLLPAISLVSLAQDLQSDGKISAQSFVPKASDFGEYSDLWYDNGHLQMMFDLTHLSDTKNTVKLSDNPSESDIENAKLIIGNAVASNDDGQHYFVKAAGGKYAGYFFMLAADSNVIQDPSTGEITTTLPGIKSGKITVREDGLLDCYAPFNTHQRTSAGIYINWAFEPSDVFDEFDSVSDAATVVTNLPIGQKEPLYTGSYGHISLDMTAHVGGSGLKDGEVGYAQYDVDNDGTSDIDLRNLYYNMILLKLGETVFGSISVNNSNQLGGMACGANGTSAMGPSLRFNDYDRNHITPAGQALTLHVDASYVDENVAVSNMRAVLHNGVAVASSGSVKKNEVSDTENATVNLSGLNPYYIRVYDCSLTAEQMLQNHFADICYYYQLDGIEELKSYGSYALNEDFYDDFVNVNIKEGDAGGIAQGKINQQLEKMAIADLSDVAELVRGKYDVAYRSYTVIASTSEQIARIETAISDIDGKISQANDITADGEAADIIHSSKDKLADIKSDLTAYKNQLTELKEQGDIDMAKITAVSEAITDPDSLDAYISTATASQLFELLCVLDGLADIYSIDGVPTLSADNGIITVDAAKISYIVELAKAASTSVDEIYSYIMNATSMTAVSIENYVKFAFMQSRVLDYAGMRTIFTVNDEAVANGYDYGEKHYEVVSYGFIMAYAANDISDIEVEYISSDGSVVSRAAGAKIIASHKDGEATVIDSRYAVTDDAKTQAVAKTNMDGSVYAIRNEMHSVPYSNLKSAYTQKYMYRAFVVFEGEGTTFTRYLDVYSKTLKTNAISLYDVASAAAAQVTDNRYLLPELYLSKVIVKVTGALPAKND